MVTSVDSLVKPGNDGMWRGTTGCVWRMTEGVFPFLVVIVRLDRTIQDACRIRN
jgi:hypothetical protein